MRWTGFHPTGEDVGERSALDGRWDYNRKDEGKWKKPGWIQFTYLTNFHWTHTVPARVLAAEIGGWANRQWGLESSGLHRHCSHNHTNKYIIYKLSTQKVRTLFQKRGRQKLRVREDLWKKVRLQLRSQRWVKAKGRNVPIRGRSTGKGPNVRKERAASRIGRKASILDWGELC